MTEANPRRRQRRKTLTDRQAAALPRKANRYTMADPEQRWHFLRIPPHGQGPVAYDTAAKNPFGKLVWSRNGAADTLSIEESRAITRDKVKRIKAGLPPVEPPAPQPDSFKSVAENWLKRYVGKQGLISQPEMERCLRVYVYPHWETRAFANLGKSDLAALLDHIEDNHGPRMADVVHGHIRGIASWYGERSDTYANPFLRLKKRAGNGKRSRILTDDELRRLWAACEQAGAFGRFVQTLLLTGQRRGAVARMKWSEIDADGVWHIPRGEREKGNAGDLKLPKLALDILKQQPRLANNDFVFWARIKRVGPITSFEDAKSRLGKRSGVIGWVLHDCRRTSRSLMSRAGVLSEHAERVMGHTIKGVEGIYDRHAYFEEKAAALAKLAALIQRIVYPPEGDVVVPIRQTAVTP
jgi:integrase